MMSTHTTTGSTSLARLSLSAYSQANPIDLTLDDDEEPNPQFDTSRATKRPRIDNSPMYNPQFGTPHYSSDGTQHAIPPPGMDNAISPFPRYPSHYPGGSQERRESYRPAFAGSSQQYILSQPQFQALKQPPPPSRSPSFTATQPSFSTQPSSDPQIIDLTGSPSPPPQSSAPPSGPNPLDNIALTAPVCIGQLQATALVLYPVSYLNAHELLAGQQEEWAQVKLQYENNPLKIGNQETIHIHAPAYRTPSGETIPAEAFGVIEQKVTNGIGSLLGKGLIRLDARVRRGQPNLPILPLRMIVCTPKGNIAPISDHLLKFGLLLDHPTSPADVQRLGGMPYANPHNPPPGGHHRNPFIPNRMVVGNVARWGTPSIPGKSVEVQRSQVDELFKSLKDGDELLETEPCFEVATTLYPHQKKALTFLLERERERKGADGKHSSLWQRRRNPLTHMDSWVHVVTQKVIYEEPEETKGAILADDMGLGKTITCVSLIAATLGSASQFASVVDDAPPPTVDTPDESVDASSFAGSVWGMPGVKPSGGSSTSAKAKAKAARLQERVEADHARVCRIKTRSRATLIICPLSTVSNWEDQFREHWRGEVTVFGGAGGACQPSSQLSQPSQSSMQADTKPPPSSGRIREGTQLRVYIYHGNARRPDPNFLADFDAVITTYATLASEFSKQNRSLMSNDAEDEDDDGNEGNSSEGVGGVEIDEHGNSVLRLPKPKKTGLKRKKSSFIASGGVEIPSALQSIHWFRVVLDEAHSIKETGTVGSRASCDLMADRRLCLTGTPVQNKLDDVYALIKFLRLKPFDDKNTWTEYIGSPVKFGHALGVARLQTIMKCITLRRTKETKTVEGNRILSLPPRRDELRLLKFDENEQSIYDQFFNASKAEFTEMSTKNEVMKNYVGILQKILRLRQICDHFELVEGKEIGGGDGQTQDAVTSYDDIVADIARDGINLSRANAIFAILRESATTQCVECGGELCIASDPAQTDAPIESTPKRSRKVKGNSSRGPTRASSPSTPRPVLTRCQHLFCLECYRNCICPGWPNVGQDVRRSCSACQFGLCPTDAVEIKLESTCDSTTKKKSQKREKRQRGGPIDDFHPSTKVKALLGDLVQFSRTNPYSTNYDPQSVEIQMVDGDGNQVDEGVVKTVVFSQWTSMLDKVEDALEVAGIRYDRLDGTMKRDDRTRAMEALKHDKGCEVLLVSLKAGGVGLNLTAAQRVYLMDPYWNPAVENQAVDRIHRLGQTRPVTTVKLIIENSIEARLLEVQRKKTELANMTLGQQNFSKADMMQRRMEELEELFG